MKCIYCKDENGTRKHEGYCPYNPVNIKKIASYLRNYAENESRFNKRLKPFPTPKELDFFLGSNKIMRLKTIRHRYFEPTGTRLEDWLSELISIGIGNGLLNEEDFPIYILYLWDTYLFRSKDEYIKAYQRAIEFEDSITNTEVQVSLFEPFVLKGS